MIRWPGLPVIGKPLNVKKGSGMVVIARRRSAAIGLFFGSLMILAVASFRSEWLYRLSLHWLHPDCWL